MDAETAVDGGQVVAHRALAEEQVPGDRGDALAPQQAAQDLELALGQVAEGGIAPPHLAGGGGVAAPRGGDLEGDAPEAVLRAGRARPRGVALPPGFPPPP